jgi:hypothetical protein
MSEDSLSGTSSYGGAYSSSAISDDPFSVPGDIARFAAEVKELRKVRRRICSL